MKWLSNFTKRFIESTKYPEFLIIQSCNNKIVIENNREGKEYLCFNSNNQLIETKWFDHAGKLTYSQYLKYDLFGQTITEETYHSIKGYQRTNRTYNEYQKLKQEALFVSENNSNWRLKRIVSIDCLSVDCVFEKREIDYSFSGHVNQVKDTKINEDVITKNKNCFLVAEVLNQGFRKQITQNEHGKMERYFGNRSELLKVIFYKVKTTTKQHEQLLSVTYEKLYEFKYTYKANRLVEELSIDYSFKNLTWYYKKKFVYRKNLVKRVKYYSSNNKRDWDLLWLKLETNHQLIQYKALDVDHPQKDLRVELLPNDYELLSRIKNVYQQEVNSSINEKTILSEALRLLVITYGEEIIDLHKKQLMISKTYKRA